MKKLALVLAGVFAVSAMALAADTEAEHKDTTDTSKNVLTGKKTTTHKHMAKKKDGKKEMKTETKTTDTQKE